ncbi:NUDIX domain-containing protein [Rossellomorea aquimaris]|uniref:NUDIX domain-containing protein n=1 Tax=Rossellomorea aquimaris TaxID=189382 RepID=UPI002495113F|nr:NUDIX domain-containing protein [Rossellomorea aquimaris]
MSNHIRVRAGAVIIKDDLILLTEYNDPVRGIVYDLPAGGVEPKESIIEAVKRESMEEACIKVEVGPLAFVYEYVPHLNNNKYGETHTLVTMFECIIKKGSFPKLPENPDSNQTGVKWISLAELEKIELYANIQNQLINYTLTKRNIDLIEEHSIQCSLDL